MLTLSLSILILFQSCKATYNDSFHSVLWDAAERDKRVKIETKDSLILEYRNVLFVEDSFLGVQKVKRMIVRTPIDIENIHAIKTENKVMMQILKITAGVIVGVLFLGYLYLDITDDSDDE